MLDTTKYIPISSLSTDQRELYYNSTNNSYPAFIKSSEAIQLYWGKMEAYFPEFQLALVDENGGLIGTINSIPFHWNKPVEELPENGWDWLIQKGVEDYENKNPANFLGGIQINILDQHRGKGLSKQIIAKAKSLKSTFGLDNFVLPIRPTLKWKFPDLKMADYIHKKEGNKIYDPWIRTHMNSGAKVIKVCSNSMNISGDIKFWINSLKKPILHSCKIHVKGALNPIVLNIENDFGEYREENLWIKYF